METPTFILWFFIMWRRRRMIYFLWRICYSMTNRNSECALWLSYQFKLSYTKQNNQSSNGNLSEEEKILENSKNLRKISDLKYQMKANIYPKIENDYHLDDFLQSKEKDFISEDEINETFIYYKNLENFDWCICFSSLELLKNLILQFEKDFGYFCLDGTYKLLKIGYPLLVLMNTDRRFKGYPVAFALVRSEN